LIDEILVLAAFGGGFLFCGILAIRSENIFGGLTAGPHLPSGNRGFDETTRREISSSFGWFTGDNNGIAQNY